jgi:TolA-binding protein
MKYTAIVFSLSFLFCGGLRAGDAVPAGDTAVAAPSKPVVRHRKHRRRAHAPARAATAPAAASIPASTSPTAAVPSKPAVAATPPTKIDALQAWLQGIKKHLMQSDVQSNRLVAVAAVRGDETSDVTPLYWKGKKPEARDEVPERKDFEAAIDLAMSGDKIAAKERLQSFMLAYPKSSYAGDAKETLARLEMN